MLKSFRSGAGIGRICGTCSQTGRSAIVFQHKSDLYDYHLGMPALVQVHRLDPYKQKRPKMLVQVPDLDLCAGIG